MRKNMDIFERKSREQLLKELGQVKAKKNVSILVFIATVAAVILLFGYFVMKQTSNKPFCDERSKITNDCKPCPEYGKCRDGRLVECQNEYKIKGDFCIKQEKNERQVFIMYNEVLDLLARRRGEYLSGNTKISQSLSIIDIEHYLAQRFDKDSDYHTNFFEVRKRLSSAQNPDVKVEYSNSQTYITSTGAVYTWGALFRIFWNDYKYLLGIALCIFVASCWFIIQMNQEILLRNTAVRYYRSIETRLLSSQHHFLLEDDLKRGLCKETGSSMSEMNAVWPYVRYEAGTRQRIDFIRKSESGIDQVGWWIDKNNTYM